MANNKKRVNTDVIFQGIIGKDTEDRKEIHSPDAIKSELPSPISDNNSPVSGSVKKTSLSEAKKQVSIYLPLTLDRNLSVQGALKEKEQDKSSLARYGIEIVLAISPQLYLKLKERAASAGISLGEVVNNILERSSCE